MIATDPPHSPSTELPLAERYRVLKQRVADAASRAKVPAGEIILVAVTKHAEMDEVRELVELGHRDFGENRVPQLLQRAAMIDEFIRRRSALGHPSHGPARWHMIGHLQRNKARKAAEAIRLVHSVDSLRLAEELQAAGLKLERPIDVLIQINVSGEESKFGCPVPAASPLADAIEEMAHLRLRGLMTMAPHSENPEDSRPHFRRLREIFEEMQLDGYGAGHFNIVSMGMSNDFEVAIEEGANVVRVGTALFGERPPEPEDEDAEG